MRLLARYIKRMMDKIDSVSLEPCIDSKFVQPYRMRYKQVSRRKLVGARDTLRNSTIFRMVSLRFGTASSNMTGACKQ